MATSNITSQYGNVIADVLSTDATSGKVTLIRCGKIRQLQFEDAVVPSGGMITITTLDTSDRPKVLSTGTLKIGNGSVVAVWVRTNGTFGWEGSSAGVRLNGELTWFVP